MDLIFEWDRGKARRNLSKHRVSFVEAASAFADDLSVTYDDPDHSTEEDRQITIGLSGRGRLLIIAHADRGERIRIISARETTRGERRLYEEGI